MTSAKIIFLIISSIIGAGFISGKEISIYFSNFGIYGLLMVIPLFFLLYYYIKLLLDFSQKNSAKNFDKLLFKNKKVYNIFCFISFCIISSSMFAAINAVFNFDLFSTQYIILYFIIFLLCLYIIHFGLDKFTKANAIIIPIVITIFLLTILLTPLNKNFIRIDTNWNLINVPYSIITYACSNVFLSHYIIIYNAKNINKNKIKTISFCCSLIICIMIAACVCCELFCPAICQFDMPLLHVAKNLSHEFYIIYCITIIYCVLSTLFSTLYSLKAFFKFKNKGANTFAPVLICFLISLFGFSNFIKYLYPFIGFFGFYMFCKLIYFNRKL